MTISSTTIRSVHDGNGITVAFPTGFAFQGAGSTAELEVIERVISTGVETTKTNVSDYTVTGGSGSSGTVTAVTAPASSVQWILRRKTTNTQEMDLTSNDSFPAETVEKEGFDRRTMVAQESVEEASRTLRFPKTDSSALSAELPSSVDRASGLLGFDGDGEPTIYATSAVTDGIVPTAFALTLLDDANAAAALVTLGALAATGSGATLTGIEDIGFNVLTPHKNLIVKQVTTATVDIDADAVLLKTTAGLGFKAASVNLTVDIGAAVGINALDAGTEASATWYYIWVIYNPTSLVTAGLLSLSATAPTMPSGYTYKGLVGAVRNNGSSNFLAFFQRGSMVTQVETKILNDGAQTSYTAIDLSTLVPPNAISVFVFAGVEPSSGTAVCTVSIASDGSTTTPTYGQIFANTVTGVATAQQIAGEIVLTTAQQIKYWVAGVNAITDVWIEGWRY